MINVHNLVKLDKYTKIIPLPKLLLMTRTFEPIGSISHYSNWRASLRGNELDEISFEVNKYVNGVLNPIWNDLIDLKIISLEHGGKFEIQVTYTDESQTIKSVNGVSLETELGQVALYDFHVNDDFYDEMEMAKHGEIIPTVLYDPEHKEYSLLHRVLADKAPQWSIDGSRMTEYVISDEEGVSEPVNKFQREYTVDGTTIYDFLVEEVAKDANVVFRFDTDNRQLWCESLVEYSGDATHQPVEAIGEDTTILVSKKKLGNTITIDSNKDSVKNCFRVEGGDDLMTSQVAVVNMTGTNYIYHFADFQLNDMPVTLKNAILAYEEWLASSSLQEEYYGEFGLYTRFVEANDLLFYFKDSMAPSIHVDPPETAQIQWQELKDKLEDNEMYIGVSDLTSYDSQYYVGVTNNVKTMLEVWCDSRYKVELVKDYEPTYNASTHTWKGVFRVTKFSDTNEHYPPVKDNPAQYEPFVFTAKIAEDSDTDLTYTRQKVEIALAKGEMSRVDDEFDDETTYEEMVEYFEQWNLVKLQSFQVGYQTCQSVLMSGKTLKGGTEPEREIAEALYAKYAERLKAVNEVLEIRQNQVNEQQDIVNQLIGYTDENGNPIKGEIQQFQEDLAFDKYLADNYGDTDHSLYYKYRSYIREDTYQNSNYISDNLESQKALTDNAKKLYHQAERELKNACVLQRTMTVSLNNLLALPEFEPLYNKFELFNYIRVRTDDEVLKLRLIGVDYSGDSMETIEVTFSDQVESVDGNISDLQSVLDQAKSIATSYTSTLLKVEKGEQARNYVNEIIDNGLNAASTMLKNSDDNEIEITRAGILAKRMNDQGLYGDKQLRIIGNGMYMTEDAWDSVAMAVGEIQFTDPISHETSWKYGVIADAIVGKILVGNQLYISNAANDANASVVIDENGITLTNGTITWGTDNVNPPEISDMPDLEEFKGQVQGALTGSATTTIGPDYVISPKIGGGYLYIKNPNDGRSVTIDPTQSYSSSGYIFKVTNNQGNTTIGADSNGNAVFNGNVTASSFTLSPNADVSGVKIIDTITYAYANSDTNTQPPDSQFGPTMNPQKGKYLWTRTTTSFQGNDYPDEKSYTCAYVGNDGTTTVVCELNISTAAVVKATDGTYTPSTITLSASSISGSDTPTAYSGRFKIETTADGSTWTTQYSSSSDESSKTYTIPASIKSIRCSLYEAGGLTTLLDQQSVPIVTDGEDGDDGKDAYTVILTNESHTFAGNTTSAIRSSVTVKAIVYKGTTQINAAIGAITGLPEGMIIDYDRQHPDTVTINVSVFEAMTTANGVLTVPVQADGITFTKEFSYAIAFTGQKGEDGEDGDDGTSISKTRIVYAVSDSSSTAPPASSFTPSRPSSITSTQFVWTRVDYSYSTAPNTWVEGTPVYDPIVTQECKSALVVKTTSTGVLIHPLGESDSNPQNYMLLTNTALDFAVNGVPKAHFGANDGIWIGGTSASPVFSVDTSGNGRFDGTIYATAGEISGWTINKYGLSTSYRKDGTGDYYETANFSINTDTSGSYVNEYSKIQSSVLIHYNYDSSDNSKYADLKRTSTFMNSYLTMEYEFKDTSYGYPLRQDKVTYSYDGIFIDRYVENRDSQGNYYNSASFGITFDGSLYTTSPGIAMFYSRNNYNDIYEINLNGEVEINNGNLEIEKNIVPSTDYHSDIGTNSYRMNNIYCYSVIQTSDKKLKNTIKSIDDSYEELFLSLKPVSYKFNEGKRTHIGYISQDVEKALENAKLSSMDFAGFCKAPKYIREKDEHGIIEEIPVLDKNGEQEYSYSLNYSEFIALNTHMIQKLYKRVEELEAELKELKNRA